MAKQTVKVSDCKSGRATQVTHTKNGSSKDYSVKGKNVFNEDGVVGKLKFDNYQTFVDFYEDEEEDDDE